MLLVTKVDFYDESRNSIYEYFQQGQNAIVSSSIKIQAIYYLFFQIDYFIQYFLFSVS